jgi:hypothetical protein
VRFLAPLFLAGAALVALPIILHLLRRDVAVRVPFTAVRLLRSTPLDRSRNRRLRDLLLLAARVAALLLLAASFARPYRPGANGSRTLTVVGVDRSFSMGAPATFQRALALARDEIDAADGRVALIAFDDRADVVVEPGIAAEARAALTTLAPGFGGTRYAALFDRAAELGENDTLTRLIVVSDLQRSGFQAAEAPLPRNIDLQVRDAGAVQRNLAVDGLDVRDGRARVSVRNYGSVRAATTIRLEQPSRAALTRQLFVDGQSSSFVDFDGVVAGPTKASIEDRDGYAADNSRFAVAQPRDLPRVLVICGVQGAGSGFYFTRALEAGAERGADFDVRRVTGAEFARLQSTDVARAAAVVVLSTHAIPRQAAESFKALFAAGGGVFVAAGPDVDVSILSELLALTPPLTADEDPRHGVLTVSDQRHPIFRPFDAVSANLAQVAFDREWQIGAAPAWKTVATFSTGSPALVEQAVGNARVLVFASDVDRRWNDFPLHPTFVPFVQEAVRYIAGRGGSNAPILISDVPDGTPPEPGFATVRGRLRAVNVDMRESAIERMTPAEFVQSVTRTAAVRPQVEARHAREREAAQGWWRYGLALMLATLVVEAFVGAR